MNWIDWVIVSVRLIVAIAAIYWTGKALRHQINKEYHEALFEMMFVVVAVIIISA